MVFAAALTLLAGGVIGAGCGGDPVVPEIAEGTPAVDAAADIKAAGFEPKVRWVADSSDTGRVISQTPAAGTARPPGSTVTLRISSGTPISTLDVLERVSSLTYSGPPTEQSPEDLLVSTQCYAPLETQAGDDTAGGSGSGPNGGVMTTAILEMPSAAAAESFVSRTRDANAACTAQGAVSAVHLLPDGTPVASFTLASAVDIAGKPGFVTKTSAAGATMRNTLVIWSQGRYVLKVTESAALPYMDSTGLPDDTRQGLAQVVEELGFAMSTELARRQSEQKTRAAIQAGLTEGADSREPTRSPTTSAPRKLVPCLPPDQSDDWRRVRAAGVACEDAVEVVEQCSDLFAKTCSTTTSQGPDFKCTARGPAIGRPGAAPFGVTVGRCVDTSDATRFVTWRATVGD